MKRYFFIISLLLSLTACNNNASRQQPAASEDNVETFLETSDVGAPAGDKQITMMELPALKKAQPEQVLRRTGFTISYNKKRKTPNWVAWHLTRSHTYGNVKRSYMEFLPDDKVPSPRATDNDYYNSRYDRGHMCPAGDNRWSEQAMEESFLFTNICPQNHGLNKNAWNDLEIQCRQWARKYGAVDIVCGPIYRDRPEADQRKIGNNKVWVPDAFFKVVLCRKGTPKAIGFIYENKGGSQPMRQCIATVDEIEDVTGYDFFPALADHIENRVEADADLGDW